MSNSGKILLGVLAGAAAGVITGILVAPASGKETRENISSKTDELLSNLKDFLNKEKAEESSKTGKKEESSTKTSSTVR
ncbi:MAG: YtxH domain-containing protein [Candidatus Delongbacteria bacterium]|jgi:gas vesicle protein|nr:YtxH domain-containing protein [Candidatus Delongbacteria bacterium]